MPTEPHVGQSAIEALSEQLRQLDLDIRRQSAAIQAFRNENGLVNGARGTLSSEHLTAILEQVAQADAERSKAAAIVEAIRQGNLEDASVLSAALDNRVVGDIKQQLAAAQAEAQSAASSLGPLHPQLQVLSSRVNTLNASLRNEIAKIEKNARKQLAAAEDVTSALRSQLSAAKINVADASTAEVAIEDTVRQLDADKQNYVTLSAQRQRLEADTFSAPGRLRLVSKAEMPLERFFPKTIPFVVGGFALALVLATVIALTRDHMAEGNASSGEKPLSSPAKRKAQPMLPLIAALQIPDLPRASPVGKANVAVKHFRLRAALQRILRDMLVQRPSSRPLVIALLSAFPSEKRSLTTMMLAICATEMGYKVLVVDANMHSSKISPMPRFAGGPGLHDILERGIAPGAAVQRVQGKLDMIGAGKGATDPVRLLDEYGIASLIDWAQDYDLVLFDSTPLDRSMDAGLLARQVDGSLFCSTEDAKELDATIFVAQRLRNLGLNIIGYVTADSGSAGAAGGNDGNIDLRRRLSR